MFSQEFKMLIRQLLILAYKACKNKFTWKSIEGREKGQ